jgi:hypothetical protein
MQRIPMERKYYSNNTNTSTYCWKETAFDNELDDNSQTTDKKGWEKANP